MAEQTQDSTFRVCHANFWSIIGQVDSQSRPFAVFRVLNVGGNANASSGNAVQYGVSASNSNNALSNANANIGSRLTFQELQKITVIPTLPKGRKQESIQSVSVAFNVTTQKKHKGAFMRNRINNCFETICSMPILEQASEQACRPRNTTIEVMEFRKNKEQLLRQLQQDLITHRFEPSDYKTYYKNERGKNRLIADLPLYPDRIVHCAIAIAIEDRLNRTLIDQTHASIKNHGTHTAIMDVRKHLYRDPRIQYVLSMDIDQYYASIKVPNVKKMLREYIKDNELLNLMDRIIDGYSRTNYPGIALGNRLSPLLANLYLSPLDHYLKENLHVHIMERYMDNYFIFGYSKKWLHHIRSETESCLGI